MFLCVVCELYFRKKKVKIVRDKIWYCGVMLSFAIYSIPSAIQILFSPVESVVVVVAVFDAVVANEVAT